MNVTVLHPRLGSLGGAELVSLHVVRRLLEQGASVRWVTLTPPDLDAAFQTTGVRIPPGSDLEVHVVPTPRWVRRPLLESAWLHRAARPIVRRADLWVSTYNEANLGLRGLQYVHHPLFADRELLRRYRISDASGGVVHTMYDQAVRAIAHTDAAAFRRNETVTNSAFMAGVLREAYGLDANVLYPGFLTGDSVHAEDRKDQMVSVGRISRDKHTIALVDLMAAVHREVPSLSFVIAGFATDGLYLEAVQARARDISLPVRFEIGLEHDDLMGLLRRSRYFISAKPFEHFGITTLDAAAAGTVPFVHRSGGSIEIIRDDRLWYESESELAMRVRSVASAPDVRLSILRGVADGLPRFQRDRFDAGLDAAVERALRRAP